MLTVHSLTLSFEPPPAEVQRRSTPVILSGADTVIASETGSGKTAACLVPALSLLDYPPELFPEDLEGPQLLLLVPSFELGVQVGGIAAACCCIVVAGGTGVHVP
jgi:superfamily II DNA/RNA helicase